MNILKIKAGKHWPLIFIFLIWVIFSFPYFFQNKIPFASDYLVNFFSPWNAYSGFASPVKNNAMPDVISQIVPWKKLTIDTWRNFQIPLWNPYSFSGTNQLANYQSAVLSPINLIFFILPFVDAWSISVLLQPLLASLFMYLYLRSILLQKTSATLGSISFMFCGFITAWMGYATLGYAILFLPLALYAIEKFLLSENKSYLILLSLTFPLSFFSGHFQISFYFSLFVLLYIVFKYFETKNKNAAILFLLYSLVGLLLSMPQILPSLEAYGQSLRSTIFQKVEAIPWGYISTFFAPDFLGNPVTRNDWFGHYAEWNGFIGTVSLVLALFAFSKVNKKIIFFALTSIGAILLAFQGPFTDLLVLLKIPVISTSALSRVIVIFSFSAAVLSAFGLENLIKELENKGKKIFYWGFLIAAIFTFLWLAAIFKILIPADKIVVAKQNLILPSILILILFCLIFTSKFLKDKLRWEKIFIVLPFAILLLASFDSLRFATKWQPFEPKNLYYPSVPIVKEFSKLRGPDRVFGNLGSEATVLYNLSSIEGYDAVYIKRYGEFISTASNGNISEAARSVVQLPKYGLYSQQILDLLGVKYFIHKTSDGRLPWAYPFWNYPNSYSLIYNDNSYQIFKNLNSYPRVFLASEYKASSDPQQIINSMFTENTDLRKTLVLEKNPMIKPDFKKGEARLISYTPNKIIIETNADGPSLLFLSDSFYPGWSAYVDGNKTEILRADYAFRAVELDRGRHEVKFVYMPKTFTLGVSLAFLGFILIVLNLKKLLTFPKFKFR